MNKFLKWGCIGCGTFLFLIVAGLVLAYNMVEDTTYETRIEVDRPVSDAWRVFAEEERMTEWLPGLVEVEILEGEREEVGSKYKLTFVEDGETIEMVETVTAVVPREEFSFSLEHELIGGEIRVLFEDLGGRTAIRTENVVRGHGFMKPFVPLMKEDMILRQEEGYRKLAAMIEAADSPAGGEPATDEPAAGEAADSE